MRHSVHAIFYDQADAHEAAERFDRALEVLYQVHRWAPQDPDLWGRMGMLSFFLTDQDWLVRHGLDGSHLADMGAVNARLYLERACTLSPESARLHLLHGWVCHTLYQDAPAAETALARALAIAPGHPYAHGAIGRMAIARGDTERAIIALERAAAALPESARFHYDLGTCHVRLERLDTARDEFRRALATQVPPTPADAIGAYLAREFHGDPQAIVGWIRTLYADVGT